MSNSDHLPALSEADFEQLRQSLAQDLRSELRRMRRQSLFAMGLQALFQVVLAIILFKAARQSFDVGLWIVGVCLLVFASLHFLDMEYTSSGRSWMDLLEGEEQ